MQQASNISGGVKFRLALLQRYLFNKAARKRTPWRQLWYHLLSPGMYAVADSKAAVIKQDEKYIYYRIKGFDDPFVYPAAAPYYSFAMVMTEARPRHWHYYEIPQTAVAPGDVVVDCGSAEGFFAFKYQHTASRIFALEPLPLFIDSLHTLFRESNTVSVLPVAAGHACETAYLEMSADDTILDGAISSAPVQGNAIAVNVVTLDSLFADQGIHIDYLKADIEGFEENMIRGALKTIRRSKPKIAITTYHEGQDYQKLIELVRGVVPEYQYLVKGIHYLSGRPVMLHMWIES